MPGIIIEICAGSTQSALNAQAGGGDRIELCSALEVGGVTPGAGMIIETKKTLYIPIFVLIRPRAGDFVYTPADVATIVREVEFCKEQGVAGVVVGALKPDGAFDLILMKELAKRAAPMQIVSHRAFDVTPDPFYSIDALADLGYCRILTNGKSHSVDGGMDLLKKMINYAGDRITIMPGGGVNTANVTELLSRTGAKEIHLTAKKKKTGFESADIHKDYSESDVDEIKKIIHITSIL